MEDSILISFLSSSMPLASDCLIGLERGEFFNDEPRDKRSLCFLSPPPVKAEKKFLIPDPFLIALMLPDFDVTTALSRMNRFC